MVEGAHVTPLPHPGPACQPRRAGGLLPPSDLTALVACKFKEGLSSSEDVGPAPSSLASRAILSRPCVTVPFSVFNCQKHHHVTEGFLEKNH